MNHNLDQFLQLDWETKPASAKLETVEVAIDATKLLGSFAVAYVRELNRRNSIRYEASGITESELETYFKALIKIRVDSCSNEGSKYYRQAKQLMIPAWIEFVLSRIGVVVDNKHGLKFVPVMDDVEINMEELLETSTKLSAFTEDGVAMHVKAMPTEIAGDKEIMSMALIDGIVHSIDIAHPVASYVAAFLGFTLRKEADFKMLYRIRYDEFDFIESMLLSERSLI